MSEFSLLPLRVIGQCNNYTQTVDYGLQTGDNMRGEGGGGRGVLPYRKDGVLAIHKVDLVRLRCSA